MEHTNELSSVFAPFSSSKLEGHSPPPTPSTRTTDSQEPWSTSYSTQETYVSTHSSFIERFDLGGHGREAWYKPNKSTIFPRKKEDVLKDLEAKKTSSSRIYERHSSIREGRERQRFDFGWDKFCVGSERVADFGFHKGPTDKYDIVGRILIDAKLSSTSNVTAKTDGHANLGETSGLGSEIDSAVAVSRVARLPSEEGVRRMKCAALPTPGLGAAVSTAPWRALVPTGMAAVPEQMGMRGFSGPGAEHVDFTDEEGISNDHDEQSFRLHSRTLVLCNETFDGEKQVDASKKMGDEEALTMREKQCQSHSEMIGGHTSLVSAVTEEWVADQCRLLEMERETDGQGYQKPVTNEDSGHSLQPSLVELVAAIEDPEMRRLSAMAYLA